jgi:hypothetical protein
MNEIEIIEKRAQIKILYHLFDRLCNSELPEIGRKAIRGLINRLTEEINDTCKPENQITDNCRDGH